MHVLAPLYVCLTPFGYLVLVGYGLPRGWYTTCFSGFHPLQLQTGNFQKEKNIFSYFDAL